MEINNVIDQYKQINKLFEEELDSIDVENRKEEINKTKHKRQMSTKPVNGYLKESNGEAKIVGKFEADNANHEIIRTTEGLYVIRYYVKDGKARSISKGVKALPSALHVLYRRFPDIEEVKQDKK